MLLARLLQLLGGRRRQQPQTAPLSATITIRPMLSAGMSIVPMLSATICVRPILSAQIFIFPIDFNGTPMSTQSKIVRRSTHLVRILGLKNEKTGAYIDTATARVTAYDPSGVAVTGAINVSATHVAGTTGATTAYDAVLPSTVDWGSGNYTVRGVVTDTDSNVREVNVNKAPVDG